MEIVAIDLPNTMDPIHVRLILNSENHGWVLEKFALRLAEQLPAWNVQAEVSDKPSESVAVNHWMLYLHYREYSRTRNTMLITHVDQPGKLRFVKEMLEDGAALGICLSRMTVEELVRHGIKRQRLCYVTPAHDEVVNPARVVIGITSRVYPDHRKRETLLIDLAKAMRLDLFHFDIMGQGWENVIPHLEAAGATVTYYKGTSDYEKDYQYTLSHIPNLDYYLYTGLDEGSMGLLDALAAGVATIVTSQGFHLDIRNGITHSFWSGAELLQIFRSIQQQRQRRIDSVRNLTWNEYARQHAIVWRALLDGRQREIDSALHGKDLSVGTLRLSWWHRIRSDVNLYRRPIVTRIERLLRLRH